jgi:glyoxylase-like metal-dependent hydrolase (beta-lactamase superfamily II)
MKLQWHNSAIVSAPTRLVNRVGQWRRHDFPIRYGLLEHPSRGLVLIDTGYAPDLFQSCDVNVIVYRNLLRPQLLPAGNAATVVSLMDARPNDVRHIVLTHLHADHMCGLRRFPQATVHASETSLQGWQTPSGFSTTHKGFFPSLLPRITELKVQAFEAAPTSVLPWGNVGHDVFGDGSLISVALPGHMPGHVGVFFPRLAKPTFHAADADWTFESLLHDQPLTLPARLIISDKSLLAQSKAVARAAHAFGIEVTLAHDMLP